jgi:signal peptidase I
MWTEFMRPTIITSDVLFFNTVVKFFHKLREFVDYVTTYCPLKYAAPRIISFFFMVLLPNAGHGLLILDEISRSHTKTQQSR